MVGGMTKVAKKGPGPKSAAKRELVDILAWRVDVVDRPANARPFLIVKDEAGPPAGEGAETAAPNADGSSSTESTEKALPALNPGTRQKLLDAASNSLEKIAAFASVVADATTDEAATDTLPVELAKQLSASVAELEALIDWYEEPTESEAEMAAKVEKAAGMSHRALRDAIYGQLKALYPTTDIWVEDLDDQFAVFTMGSKLFRHAYSVAGAEVTLGGTPEEVMVTYAPVAAPPAGEAAPPANGSTEMAASEAGNAEATTTAAEIAKSFEAFTKRFEAAHKEFVATIETKLQKNEGDLAAMRARVASAEGRLAIGKSEGLGNARTETPEAPTKAPFRWSRDLSEDVRAEQQKSGA